MDQKDEKKHGGVYGKQNLQSTDQLIKDITLISVTQGSKIQSNWDQIKKYKLDNNRIKEKINFVVKKNEIEDVTQKQKIQKIQEQGQQWTKKILIELERQELLRKEIEKVQQSIQQKNLKIGQGQHQIGQQISEQEQISQQRRLLQQKLDKLKAKNNKMIAEIQKLKEEVKISRNERAFFDNVFKNLERDMKNKEELIKQFVLDNTLNGYELKKQEEVNVMISKLMEKEQQLFKIAYESQMLSKPNEIYNIEELTSSIQVDNNSKIKETLDEEDEEEEENNFDSKNEPNQTQNLSKIQEMKYENFLKLKKELIAKVSNDKAECDNKTEQIKKLLLMTNTESIDQFKLDYKKNDDQIEELYKQSEYLNGAISSLRKQIQDIDSEISGYQEQKDDLIRQMDQKKQINTEKDRLIRDIRQIQDTQKCIKENNIQIEEDLHVFCKLIPPMLRELNVMSDEFLRENIHMNIHPNNVLDFFGTIEKKTTLANLIFNRLQETKFANVRKSKKKMTFLNSNASSVKESSTTKLPFNYVKIMEREKKQKHLIDYLNKMDHEKEADSLMMPSHFKQQCQVDFSKLSQNSNPQKQFSQVRESIRVLSHFQQSPKKKNGVK